MLQLAIQGKLVEQRPEEGTGEELYRQIQAEKQRLIKSGLLKKEKNYQHINNDECPNDIPSNWMWVYLGQICSIRTGKKDANFGTFNGEYVFFTCARDPLRCNSYSFSGESILMAGNGDIGNISYYDGNFEAYQRTYVLQPYLDKTYLRYVYYHIQSNWVTYNSSQTYGTAIPYIRLGNVENYIVALPPLAEQKRIVAKIEELLPYLDRYEKAWNRLEDFNRRFPADMQKSILQMAIQGKLVEQRPEEGTGEELYRQIQAEKQALIKAGKIKKEKPLPEIAEDEVPFEIPEGWKWVRLKWLSESIVDCPHSTPTYYENDTGYFAIDTNCITAEGTIVKWRYVDAVTYDARIARLVPRGGDIVYTREGSICRAVILPDDKKVCLGQRVMLIRCANGVTSEYVKRILMAPQTIAVLTAQQKGIGAKHVNVADVCRLPIPLPPLAEQKRIVARLEGVLPLCERLK